MRKSVLLFTMICVAVCGLQAQQRIEVQKNLEGKKLDAAFVREARYLGQYDGLYCFVGDGYKHRKRLVLVDHNMEPLRVMEMPESSANCDVMASSISGSTVSMLLVDNDPRGQALVFRGSYDLDSMRPAEGGRGLELLDSVPFGRNDRCLVWAGTSPNARYNGIVMIVEFTDRKQYSAKAVLFDAQMKEVWHYDYAMGSMNDLKVTDDGSIVTLGYEIEGEETHFVFNIMDAKRGDTYDAVIKCDPIRELKLAGVLGSHIMAVGLFNPWEAHTGSNVCGGVVGLSFDKDSAILTGFTMRPFQNEDINIMYNTKTKKVQREQEVELVSVVGTVMTQEGAVVAVGRNYSRENIEDNGSVTYSYHRVGLHLVSVDTLGHVRWARNIRRNDMQKKNDNMLNVSLLQNNGRIYIMKSENKKYPAIYDIAKEAKEFKVGSKGNLVLYSIGREGDVEKSVIERKTPYSLVRSLVRPDGVMALYTQDGSRTRVVELRVK